MFHGVPHPWSGALNSMHSHLHHWQKLLYLRCCTTWESSRKRRIYHNSNIVWSYLQRNILPDKYPTWISGWISPACHLKKENYFVIGKLFLYLWSHLLHFPSILLMILYTFMKSNSRLHYCSKCWHSCRKWKTAITFPPALQVLEEVDQTRESSDLG